MTDIKPVIGILGGTGKEGPGLAMRWAVSGYRIIIGSRQEEKARTTADGINNELGTTIISGMENHDAARNADICVLTVVQSAHDVALKGLKEVLQGKILIDATARVDFRDPKPPLPPSAGEIAQEILGSGVTVVAAFQNVPAHSLRNLEEPIYSDVLVCANDVNAAEKVIQLAEDGGMRAYYAGSLVQSVIVEGLTSLLINMNKYYKKKSASIKITGL
jgi:NADPH-dependent F420 reductase